MGVLGAWLFRQHDLLLFSCVMLLLQRRQDCMNVERGSLQRKLSLKHYINKFDLLILFEHSLAFLEH